MKCTALVNLLVISLVLGSSGVGCRRKAQNLTPLPRRESRVPEDNSKPPLLTPTDRALTSQPPINTEPIPRPEPPTIRTTEPGGGALPNTPRDGWPQDREMFREQTVYFDFDKSAIKPSEVGKLQTVASKFKGMPGKALRIEGHCDERGTEEYNRSLGERRALAVREKLVSFGVEANLIDTVSFGEDKPVDPGHNESAWSQNRRGEIILLSPPTAQ